MAMELWNSYKGEAMTEGFEVLPIEGEATATVEKPIATETVATDTAIVTVEKPKRTRKAKVEKPKRKAGRPRVYNGTHRRMVAAALKKHGLTKGMEWLAKERDMKVSLTLARSVAKEMGIKFVQGRPKAA